VDHVFKALLGGGRASHYTHISNCLRQLNKSKDIILTSTGIAKAEATIAVKEEPFLLLLSFPSLLQVRRGELLST